MREKFWDLPALRPGHAASDALAARRASMAGGLDHATDPRVAFRKSAPAGVNCLVAQPPEPAGTILYLHGGGFRMGEVLRWQPFAAQLAMRTGCSVVLVEYRLAPEHPFPAGLHDAVAVYRELRHAGQQLAIAGDSAGGGLAAALVAASIAAPEGPPAALVLISPWLDLTVTAKSYATGAPLDQLFSRAAAEDAAALYLQGHSATDPRASPLFADLRGFPPTLILVGTEEVLLDDSLQFAASLARARQSVDLHVVAGMQHVWPTLFPQLRESDVALDVMAHFLRRHGGHTRP